MTILGLVLVTVLSLGYAGYAALTPSGVHTTTAQQTVTNTQNAYILQTQVTTSTSIFTTTMTVAYNSGQNVYGQGPYCDFYGCYMSQGNGYTPCQATGTGNAVQCYGYLYDGGSGCTELSVWTNDPAYHRAGVSYVHYRLQNLPSNYPAMGTWVHVTGQLYLGNDTISTMSGASCPNSYINVNSISA